MRYCLILILLLPGIRVWAQTGDSITARIILVGDGGALVNGKHPVVSAIRHHMNPDKKTTIVFLGDNLYKKGMPDAASAQYAAVRAVLDSQVSVAANTPAQVYMIPGNHDWENGGVYGWNALRRQQLYINLLKDKNVHFVPQGGCPGPVEVPISKDVVMIVFDSQWWLHPNEKPGIESDCDCKTESEVLTQLSELLRKNYKKLVILACHHPFLSNGVHGGYFGLKQHIFPFTDLRKNLYIPLPVIGSIYPISRSVFGSPQDVKHPTYANMINEIKEVVKIHPHVIFASGHDHSLQLLKDSSYNYIVSGAGCKVTRVEKSRKSQYVSDSLGFAVMEVSKNKIVRVNFYTVDPVTELPTESYSNTILDFSKLPPLAEDTATVQVPKFQDYITAPASKQYKDPSGVRRFVIGDNYRAAWEQEVKFKVFRLNEEKGGFKIESMGGGKQTKSLTLIDKKGKAWALRTIDKDPDQVMPSGMKNSFAEDIVQDEISSAQPYAPLVMSELAKAAKIPHAKPEYFLVPDDPALGFYRPLFANKICMLEAKDASVDGTDTKSTMTVIDNMLEDNDHRVLQKEVLNARLLDILAADWDRHMEQWKWGVQDTGKGKLYYPIPKDRDQAFFFSDGALLAIASRRMLPYLKGFRERIRDINHLGSAAKDFDRLFMNELDGKDWENGVVRFTGYMTDTAIKKAVKSMPPEIYAIDGERITNKLISRRNQLQKQALVYYNFISKYVNIPGSNKDEYFKVLNEGDNIRVRVLEKKDHGTGIVLYDRVFKPSETKEIRLYGLNGNDVFQVDADARKKTYLRIIGGKGTDTFNIKGNVRNYIYDLSTEKNYVQEGRKTKNAFSADPLVNDYNINEYKYNITRFPRINIGFNGDDGLMMGLGVWYRRHAFRKTPYASDQRLTTLFAFAQKAYQFSYRGNFVNVLKQTDLVVKADLLNPVLDNFFGFGNTTTIDKSKSIRFYRARYKYVSADVLLRKKLGNVFSVMAGPAFYHYWNKPSNNEGYILEKPIVAGLDSANVYSRKTYAGGKLAALVYNLNNELFPTRGISWYTEFSSVYPLSKNDHRLTKLQSDMAVYASLNSPANFVTVLRLGGGHIFSDNFEYFQALTLGANNFLRGFRKNRFAGNSLAYGSLEFRIKLFESKSYILPGAVGLVAFNDVGRVWMKNENSKRWHDAYGGGFYYVPFNLMLVSATIGFSQEEQLFNFTLGTKLNLTF